MADSDSEDFRGFAELPDSYFEALSDSWIARSDIIWRLEKELEEVETAAGAMLYLEVDLKDAHTQREEMSEQSRRSNAMVELEVEDAPALMEEVDEQGRRSEAIMDPELQVEDAPTLRKKATPLKAWFNEPYPIGFWGIWEQVDEQSRNSYSGGVGMAGGGATEIELARQVSAWGETHAGLKQYSINKFSEAIVDLELQVEVEQQADILTDNELNVDRENEEEQLQSQIKAPKKNVRKTARCGQCKGCTTVEDCKLSLCVPCKDMTKNGGPGKMKAGCRKKICLNPRKKTPCSQCDGCLTKEDCLDCIPCKDMKRHGGPGKLKAACTKRGCSDPLWLSKAALTERVQEQSLAVTLGAAGEEAQEIRFEMEDLGFATTPGFTPFPARIDTRVGIGERILVNFYGTGEGAFIPRADWRPYSVELVQHLLEDANANRCGFGKALAELQWDLASLDGEHVDVSRPSTSSNTMLGAPRRLGPVSRQGLMEDGAFNTAAFQEKMFLKNRKWACKQCPAYQTNKLMEAERHARICGQRPRVPRPSSTAVKFVCSASDCSSKFVSIRELNIHYKSAHPDHGRPRRCPECRKVYVDEVTLKAHLRATHGGVAKEDAVIFSCPYCDYTSDRKFNLEKIHVPRKHPALLALALSTEDNEHNPLENEEQTEDPNEDQNEEERDNLDEQEGDKAESDNEDDEEEPEPEDPVMRALNLKIRELRSRFDGLAEYELLQLGNLEERRTLWQQESQPNWMEEFKKQPNKCRRREKKRQTDMEQSGVRKSARLMASQVTNEESNIGQADFSQEDHQQLQELVERELQMVEDREAESEHLENAIMVARLVAHIVNCTLGEQHKCEICGKVFNDKWHLEEQHFKVMHVPGEQPVPCTKDFCRKDFPTQFEMEQHRRVCSFKCPNCGVEISRCGRVEGHLRRCTGLG